MHSRATTGAALHLLEVAVDLPQGSICNFLIIVLGIVDYRFSEL